MRRLLVTLTLFAAACSGEIDAYPGGSAAAPRGPDGRPLGGSGASDPANAGRGSQTDGRGGAGPGSGNGGSSGSDGTDDPNGPLPSFACDDAAQPPVATLRRLTVTEYGNSLRELVRFAVGDDTQAEQVMSALAPALATLPEDRREPTADDLHGSYRRLDQSLQQSHVDGYFAVGTALGAALTTAQRLERVVGACATDADAANDAQCLRGFIERFGARALRRALDADEVEFYTSVYGATATADPLAYADLIGVLMNAPEAVYFVEHGADELAAQPGVYEVDAFELASRLSFQLWQTAPDDALRAAAADGSLLDDDVYAAQVDRLLDDPRAHTVLAEFFADWLKVEELPALDAKNQDPVFAAFAGDALPTAGLRQAMIDDVLGLLEHASWSGADVPSLFRNEQSFARSEELAALYGVPVWDGNSEPPSFPAGERPGLLTRALFLATGSPNTRPIMKGVFVRKQILCDELPPPPPGANAKPPELRPDMTTREVVEELTETPGTVCAGCHSALINPLGFATEGFDALGRLRSEQRLFDMDGSELGSKPIDTGTIPNVVLGDDTPSRGIADLSEQIAVSGKAEACIARNFFRFTYARWEDEELDGCALESLRSALDAGGTIPDLLRAAVLSPEFRRRRFE
jgi:hypothetical protein